MYGGWPGVGGREGYRKKIITVKVIMMIIVTRTKTITTMIIK